MTQLLTLYALAIVAIIILVIFLAYGTGFHRGHISGFHEGMDVARDDSRLSRQTTAIGTPSRIRHDSIAESS